MVTKATTALVLTLSTMLCEHIKKRWVAPGFRQKARGLEKKKKKSLSSRREGAIVSIFGNSSEIELLVNFVFLHHKVDDDNDGKKILESCATPNWSNGSVGQKESRSQVPDTQPRIPNPRS